MIRGTVLSRYLVLISLFAVMAGCAQETESQTGHDIPKLKQTNLGLYLTAKEAFEKWEAAPENVFVLDVRTPEEYIFVGHAEMAWNIPLAFQTYDWDSTTQHFSIRPNPEFVSQVTEQFSLDDTLLVMCRSGHRSAMAVNLLAEAGFKNVFNIIDGMEGDMVKHFESVHGDLPLSLAFDPLLAQLLPEAAAGDTVQLSLHSVNVAEGVFREKRTLNGWKNSGSPWTYKINPERMKLPVDNASISRPEGR
jgi:rhodanese-related sulfurtransferase